jgi:hypothetical protein
MLCVFESKYIPLLLLKSHNTQVKKKFIFAQVGNVVIFGVGVSIATFLFKLVLGTYTIPAF